MGQDGKRQRVYLIVIYYLNVSNLLTCIQSHLPANISIVITFISYKNENNLNSYKNSMIVNLLELQLEFYMNHILIYWIFFRLSSLLKIKNFLPETLPISESNRPWFAKEFWFLFKFEICWWEYCELGVVEQEDVVCVEYTLVSNWTSLEKCWDMDLVLSIIDSVKLVFG